MQKTRNFPARSKFPWQYHPAIPIQVIYIVQYQHTTTSLCNINIIPQYKHNTTSSCNIISMNFKKALSLVRLVSRVNVYKLGLTRYIQLQTKNSIDRNLLLIENNYYSFKKRLWLAGDYLASNQSFRSTWLSTRKPRWMLTLQKVASINPKFCQFKNNITNIIGIDKHTTTQYNIILQYQHNASSFYNININTTLICNINTTQHHSAISTQQNIAMQYLHNKALYIKRYLHKTTSSFKMDKTHLRP